MSESWVCAREEPWGQDEVAGGGRSRGPARGPAEKEGPPFLSFSFFF